MNIKPQQLINRYRYGERTPTMKFTPKNIGFEIRFGRVFVDETLFPDNASKALEHSIAKWQALVKYLEKNKNTKILAPITLDNSCALCNLFTRNDSNCDGCPVSNFTGRESCLDTPYTRYALLSGNLISQESIECAKAEVRFLESLRKK